MNTALALTVVRKMAPQLIKSGLVFILSMALMQVSRELGIILMMAYSSLMVVKSAKREMPLGTFTALLPGGISLFCFLFMLTFIGVRDIAMPLIGVVLGLVPGFLMARGHKIYEVGGRPFAKRTYFYILIWAISLLFTQGSTLLGLRQVMDFGFLLNGFSTSMAVILSIFLYTKSKSIGGPQPPAGATLTMFLLVAVSMCFFAVSVTSATAYTIGNPRSDSGQIAKAGQYVFQEELSRLGKLGGQKTEDGLKDSSTYTLVVESKTTGRQGVLASGAQVKMGLTYYPRSKTNWTQSIQSLNGVYNHKMQKGSALRKGTLRQGGEGYYWVMSEIRNNFDDVIQVIGLWKYKDWVVSYTYVGVPTQNGNLLQTSPITDFENSMRRIQSRVKQLGIGTPQPAPQPHPQPQPAPQPQPVPQPQPQPDPEPQPQPQPNQTVGEDPSAEADLAEIIDEMVAVMENALNNVGFTKGAAAAGLAIAIVQLLSGLGMTAAYTAAVEVAAAVDAAVAQHGAPGSPHAQSAPQAPSQAQTPDPLQPETEFKEGQEALDWLEANGYYDENGNLKDWIDDPSLPDLYGIAGYEDDDGNPTEDVVIVIEKGSGVPPAQTDMDAEHPDQSVDNHGQQANVSQDDSKDDSVKGDKQDDGTEKPQVPPQQTPVQEAQPQPEEKTETGIPAPLPPTTPEQIDEITERVRKIIKDKKAEGYYVRNRTIEVTGNYYVDKVITGLNKGINNVGELPAAIGFPGLTWHPYDYITGQTGGQCGEYGEWGGKWSRDDIKEVFGEESVMTQITAGTGSNNHNATRVITPNGDRYVLDFWRGMQGKKTVFAEEEWVAAEAKSGRTGITRSWSGDKADTLNGAEGILNKYINSKGEEEGIRKYLEQAIPKERAEREAIVRSYRKSPWPTI